MDLPNNRVNEKTSYMPILVREWKEIIGFVFKRDKNAHITIVETPFLKLIQSELQGGFEDTEVSFDLQVPFSKLGEVLKYMGKSALYNQLFNRGEIGEDGKFVGGSTIVWEQSTGQLLTTLENGETIGMRVLMDFQNNLVNASVSWATIKAILPLVDKELGLILAMTSLKSITKNKK